MNTIRLLDTDLFRNTVSRWGTQGMRYVNVGFFEVIATGEKFIGAVTHPDAGNLVGTEDLNGDSIVVPITVDTQAPQLLELKPVSDASGNYLELTISENTNLADVFVMNPGNTRILAESPYAINNGDGT
ncbi:MAG: hypothetical protein IKB82_00235, partial [Clostridia bacterium]|nr:hypothetical protein [Clostridia bacterium]